MKPKSEEELLRALGEDMGFRPKEPEQSKPDETEEGMKRAMRAWEWMVAKDGLPNFNKDGEK